MKFKKLHFLNSMIFFIGINFLIANSTLGLSKKNVFNHDRDVSFSRGTYLIVTPNESVLESLNNEGQGGNFIEFKRSQGYDVAEMLISDNISAEDLKTEIMTFYEDNPLLEYVLLIGDVNATGLTIPTFTIPSINENELDVTDYNYTYTDDPLNPHFLIGRWSIRVVPELWKIVARTIQYTRMDNLDDYSHLGKALLVAGNFSGDEIPPYQWPVTPVWTSKWLQDKLYIEGYTNVDTAFFHQGNYTEGDQNPLIASSWNEGVGIINYRGWGDANGWHKPYFHREEIANLLLPSWKIPIVFSFVCNTGDFGNDYGGIGLSRCFGESLIYEGFSFNTPKGAAAMIGPSDLDTDTRYNNVICGALWDNILEGRTYELAAALHTGKQALIKEFPANENNIVEFNHHIYGTIGDPSIPVWIGEPSNFNCELDENLTESYIQTTILDDNGIPIEDVVGALLVNGELVSKGLSLENGNLYIDFDEVNIGESLDLYLNKPQYFQKHIVLNYASDNNNDYIPEVNVEFEIVPIVNDDQGYVIANESFDLSLSLINISNQNYENISISVIEISDGISNEISNQQFNLSVDSFSTFQTGTLFSGLVNDISKGSSIDLLATVSINNNEVGQYPISILVGPILSTDPMPPDGYGYWAYDNMDTDYSEHPTYDWIELNPDNGGEGTDLLLKDDTLIEIDLDFDFKYYGNIYNTLTVCSNGWVSFEPLDIPYFWNFSIPMPLGPSAMIAPFFDDLDDNGYEKCIDSNNNGECENAENYTDINNNGTWDQGEDYDDLNGNGIWDAAEYIDLDLDGEWDAGEPFKVFKFFDEINNRIVIQWDNLANAEDDDLCPNCVRETFQLILNDPNFHNTLTGDGEIIFQYKEIHDIDDNGNFSTIGIESPNQNDGLQILFANNLHPSSPTIDNGFQTLAYKFTTNAPLNALLTKSEILPISYNIINAYPNPFNPKVNIGYNLIAPQKITLEIFDVLGKKIATLDDSFKSAGYHTLVWDGSEYASGSYFIRLRTQAGNYTTKIITLLK